MNKEEETPLLETLENIGHAISSFFCPKAKGVSLIIPAYNEEKTIKNVIEKAQKVSAISEIIVIDDGSKDKTARISKACGVDVITHHKNLGKGEALKTGIFHASGEILLFLDADWENITSGKIWAIIKPILKDRADFVKAAFNLQRGRVTEFAIKPIMKVLYPETSFEQPISGQFAGKKEFLEKVQIEPRWGIDIAILLDAIKEDLRIVEVHVGEIVHKGRTSDEKAEMSKQVMETILKRAGMICDNHKAIIFSEKTILSPIFEDKAKRFLEILKSKKIKIILLSSEEVDSEFKKCFDVVLDNNPDITEKNSRIVKSILKKEKISLGDTVLAVNSKGFEDIIDKVCLSFCFKSAPEEIKENSQLISSLSDILMYLK